jgi:hypothetical protein
MKVVRLEGTPQTTICGLDVLRVLSGFLGIFMAESRVSRGRGKKNHIQIYM